MVDEKSSDHKKHCVFAAFPDDSHHRTPIDCVSIEELWSELKAKTEEVKRLKIRIYDLEHDET